MYYTVIRQDGHLRTRGKCRKHEPQASVFYIFRVFSNVRSVLSRCNSDKTWVFDQSERAQGPIYVIIKHYTMLYEYGKRTRDYFEAFLLFF